MFVPEVRHFVPTISIVGDDFCYPYLVDLVVKKNTGFLGTHIDVLDDNGILLLQVDGSFWHLKKKRTMHNSIGLPIITMRRKGETSDDSDLLYTIQKTRCFQLKTELKVFLASNLTGEICDFRVIGSYVSHSCKVYKGDTLITEVKERFKLESLRKERFEARIYPGVDYAFIMSLLVILNEIDS
ncbi:hypothetical protein BUALT_Bualt01G0189800 [Buddleja alternifolia]|uniref:Uncharacterized protein n=1 Tax=Buddleja alternifolia TaxID=168488 RepID=A0AAV6YGU6_9LAMI|nr:hypothetical protein BUALT_Bualt01G0189800 [Buddleja alternifolia]